MLKEAVGGRLSFLALPPFILDPRACYFATQVYSLAANGDPEKAITLFCDCSGADP